jgi:O-antigen/teichoic acid export membrane protein
MIQEVWPIAVILACDILLRRSGILFLSVMRPMTEVAIYGTAAKTIDALTLFTISLTGALLPLLASRWEKGAKAGWRAYRYSLRYFTVLGMGISAGAFMLARPLLLLFLGPTYAESLIPFRILILVFFMGFVGRPMAAMLLVSQEQLIAFLPRALAVIAITVGLSLWLIPLYGYLAAGWISVASSAGLLFFTSRLTRRLTNEGIPWRQFLVRPLVAALGMAAVLYLVQGGSLFWTVPLGAASYGLLLVLLREFDAPEYNPLRRTWTTLWQGRLAR